MKDKLPNVLNSTKKHHKQIKKEILFAFFLNFIPSVAESGTTTEGALSCQFEDRIRILLTTAGSHFLSLVNTNWTVLKCLNRPRQSFRYTGSEDINPKVSPGSTEIMKMGLFLEGGLKNSQLLLLVRHPLLRSSRDFILLLFFECMDDLNSLHFICVPV